VRACLPLLCLGYPHQPFCLRRRWYLGFLVLFVLSNLFMLQPWSLDNVKIINIYMFGATAVVALGLVKLFYLNQPPDQEDEEEEEEQAETVSGSSWAVFALYDSITTRLCEICDHPFLRTTPIVMLARVIVVLVVVSLCFSGVLSVIRERNLHWQFQDSEDMATAQWIIEHTKPSVGGFSFPLCFFFFQAFFFLCLPQARATSFQPRPTQADSRLLGMEVCAQLTGHSCVGSTHVIPGRLAQHTRL